MVSFSDAPWVPPENDNGAGSTGLRFRRSSAQMVLCGAKLAVNPFLGGPMCLTMKAHSVNDASKSTSESSHLLSLQISILQCTRIFNNQNFDCLGSLITLGCAHLWKVHLFLFFGKKFMRVRRSSSQKTSGKSFRI